MGGIIFKSRVKLERSAKNLSIVIITFNEERNLISLLPEIPKGAELIVVDSGSTDRTAELAEQYGARFEVRPFDNYASQKNHALSLATRPWTLSLDADERPDDLLWSEIIDVSDGSVADAEVFALKRRLVFLGSPLNHGRSKDLVTRLFKTNGATYRNEIHEELVFKTYRGKVACLQGHLWHWSYRDLTDYFVKFNRYTDMMARSRFEANKSSPSCIILALRIPADFFVRYIAKLGFLDGWYGFLWALLGSVYGFIKYAKLKELYRESKQLS